MGETRFVLEWGIGAVFGLPIAVIFGAIEREAGSCLSIHLGPIYFMLSWRAA